MHTLSGHRDRVEAVAVLPDSRRIISASYDGTLKIWNLVTGTALQTIPYQAATYRSQFRVERHAAVAVTSNGYQAISAFDEGSGYDEVVMQALFQHQDTDTMQRAIDQNRKTVNTLQIWELTTGTISVHKV